MTENEKKSILQMSRGAFLERADYEVTKVLENILDPNTSATAKRKITITLELKPDDTRQNIAVSCVAKSTLAATNPVTTSLYKTEGSNNMGIIEFDETGMKNAAGAVTAAAYCARMAGILCGIPMGMSATYASLPELTEVTARSSAEQTTAIDAGKLILIHDGQKAKIARAVNSLTTIPANGSEDWRKIKIVEGMDLITYFLRTTIEDSYVGQYPNTYDNKQLLVAFILQYLQELETAGVLNPGSSYCEIDYDRQLNWLRSQGVEVSSLTRQQVLEYQTGSWVFIKCGGRLVDAMEDFEILFNAQTLAAAA